MHNIQCLEQSPGFCAIGSVGVLNYNKDHYDIAQGSFFPPHGWGGSDFEFPPQTPPEWGG